MNPAFTLLLHHMACGAVAAAGFAVLFNARFSMLPWCAASGALTLAVRTLCLNAGASLEGASFGAALAAGLAGLLLRRARPDMPRHALVVVGCIPMVPGSFAAKAILGLYALTTGASQNAETLVTAMQFSLRVAFVIIAIGTGLAIPTLLARVTPLRRSASAP
jgi:uncharacterized membrane protein YjjB (DUF3815 family)